MSLIASSSTDLKFHLCPDGFLQHTYLPPNYLSGYIKSISWGKDSSWMVIVPSSGYAEILTVKETAKCLLKIKDIHQPTCAIFPKTTKKFVALGTHSGQVLIYDVKNKSVKKRFPRASSSIQSIDCNAKDTHLACATGGGDILVYNITMAKLTAAYKIFNSSNVSTLSFHCTERNLLTAGSEEGVVAIWDTNMNAQIASFQVHYAPVTEVAPSPIRSDLIAAVGRDRQLTFYDIHNKKCIVQMEVPISMLALDFSHCGVYLGMGSQNGHIWIYDIRNLAKPVNEFPAHEGKRITKIAFQKGLSKVEEASTSSSFLEKNIFNVTAEEVKHSSSNNSPFACYEQEVICNRRNESDNHEQTKDVEDSFMKALGNFNNINVYTPEQENYKHRMSDTGYSVNLNSGQNSTEKRLSHLKDSAKKTPGNKQISSTPKCYMHNEIPPTESPIMMQPSITNTADIEKAVREIIQKEISTLRLDIIGRYEFMQAMAEMRKHFLDTQMFLVKHFVNVENMVCNVRGLTIEEYLSNTVEENNRLKQEIEQLKKKIMEHDGPL